MKKLLDRRVPSRALRWLCVAALFLSLIPMYALSFYNHASYDDFGFSILTHAAWRDSGSFAQVFAAAVRNTVGIRQTWEGTYTTSFISAFQPALFGENLYWLTTTVLLTFFLIALWFFLRQALTKWLRADLTAQITLFCAVAFVMIQFVPQPSEAFFWFNGGVAYTLMWSFMLLRWGVWIAFVQANGNAKRVLWYALLMALTLVMGGAKYSTVLLAALVDALIVAGVFIRKRKGRAAALGAFMLLMACFVFSMVAPGNGVRAQTLSSSVSAPKAVLQAFYFGFGLMGHWFSLPLLVVWAFAAWLLVPALRRSEWRFSHPVWFTLLCACLFCAQLAPTLVTGNYLGDGRALNTYYDTYVLMGGVLALYWTGYAMRRLKWPQWPTDSLRVSALLAAIVLLGVGCVSYHPQGSASYGPQNMASGSALRSLMSGQAAAYDAAMDKRDRVLNDPAVTEPTLIVVPEIPAAFMGDALGGREQDYVLYLYGEYYQKQRVSVAQEE